MKLFSRIMTALQALHLDQLETQRRLTMLERTMSTNGSNDLPSSFADKYNLSLPLSSIEDFEIFESSLKNDSNCRKDLVSFTFKNSIFFNNNRDI